MTQYGWSPNLRPLPHQLILLGANRKQSFLKIKFPIFVRKNTLEEKHFQKIRNVTGLTCFLLKFVRPPKKFVFYGKTQTLEYSSELSGWTYIAKLKKLLLD